MKALTRWLLFAGLFLLLFTCHKECVTDCDGWDRGVITGIDYRKCRYPCCGGWFIEIGGDTLRAPELPPEFANTLSDDRYPVAVCLRWKEYSEPCSGDEIEVIAIRRR